jgi:uncharacterized membrane protein
MKHAKVSKIAAAAAMVAVVVLWRHNAWAFQLGIAGLDGFLQSIEDGIPRCGLLMALVGGAAVTLAKFENHFNSFFSSYINYFVTAGVFGGLVTILGTIGIVG